MAYRGTGVRCPRCGAVLQGDLAAHDKTPLCCPACQGAFVTNALLARTQPTLARVIPSAMSVTPLVPLVCPHCGNAMRRLVVPVEGETLQVDFCNAHGAWFEAVARTRLGTG
jgi:ssDNA-binding Zn-finger/Zn-ribbon topoisomerase 1